MKITFTSLVLIFTILMFSGCCGKNGCSSNGRSIQNVHCDSNRNNSERQECYNSNNNSYNPNQFKNFN